ncbi:MAG: hypothetical protein WC974_00540 [Thermoplasmata archaeon]
MLGVETEISILIFSTVLGTLNFLGAYLLMGEIINDDRFKIVVAFVYSLSPLILKFTIWTASTRGLFIALLPLFLWCILKLVNKHHIWKYMGLSIFLLLLLTATHRMVWFVVVPIIFYIAATFIHNTGTSKSSFGMYASKILLIPVMIAIFAVFFIATYHFILPADSTFQSIISTLIENKYSVFLFLVSTGVLMIFFQLYVKTHTITMMTGVGLVALFATLISMQLTDLAVLRDFSGVLALDVPFVEESEAIYYPQLFFLTSVIILGARYGIMIFFMAIGIILLSFKQKKIGNNVMILTSLFFINTILFVEYSHDFLAIFLFIVAGYGVFWYIENWRSVKRYAFSMLAIILLLSLVFSAYTLGYRYSNMFPTTGDHNYMVDPTYQTGIFLRTYANGTFYGNDFEALRVAASSGLVYLGTIQYEFVDKEKMTIIPKDFSIAGLPNYMKNPFIIVKSNITSIDTRYDCDSEIARNFTSYYSIEYLVSNIVVMTDKSVFANSVYGKRYEMFANERDIIFYL